MDRIDTALLAQLQADASLSVGDLAERVHISKSACWRRVRKLEEDGVIRRRIALLDPAAVGLPLTVFILVRTSHHNRDWSRHFQEVVTGIPGILDAYRMGGDIDYLLKAVVADMQGYDRLYQELIQADLFDVTASFVMEELKHTSELPLPA